MKTCQTRRIDEEEQAKESNVPELTAREISLVAPDLGIKENTAASEELKTMVFIPIRGFWRSMLRLSQFMCRHKTVNIAKRP